MKIMICVGSTCHLCGSKKVVTRFQELVDEHKLQASVELAGKFCMGNCQNGVCVTLDDENFSLTPETTRSFFEKDVLPRLK